MRKIPNGNGFGYRKLKDDKPPSLIIQEEEPVEPVIKEPNAAQKREVKTILDNQKKIDGEGERKYKKGKASKKQKWNRIFKKS